MIVKLVSGGQAGVDRAALDVALEQGLVTHGWMPAGFLAEDGEHPEFEKKYGLRQMTTKGYPERTRRNVQISDATLILVDSPEQVTGGTRLTANIAKELGKRHVIVFMECEGSASFTAGWLHCCGNAVVNFAGPRESRAPGIYQRTCVFLRKVFEELKHERQGSGS